MALYHSRQPLLPLPAALPAAAMQAPSLPKQQRLCAPRGALRRNRSCCSHRPAAAAAAAASTSPPVYTAVNRYRCMTPHAAAEFQLETERRAAAAAAQPGHVSYGAAEVASPVAGAREWVVTQVWASKQAYEAYMNSHFRRTSVLPAGVMQYRRDCRRRGRAREGETAALTPTTVAASCRPVNKFSVPEEFAPWVEEKTAAKPGKAEAKEDE